MVPEREVSTVIIEEEEGDKREECFLIIIFLFIIAITATISGAYLSLVFY